MRRRYEVPQEPPPEDEDESFRLCFCTMFVLLVLFLLTCIAFWPRNFTPPKATYSQTVRHSLSGTENRKKSPNITTTQVKSIFSSTESEIALTTKMVTLPSLEEGMSESEAKLSSLTTPTNKKLLSSWNPPFSVSNEEDVTFSLHTSKSALKDNVESHFTSVSYDIGTQTSLESDVTIMSVTDKTLKLDENERTFENSIKTSEASTTVFESNSEIASQYTSSSNSGTNVKTENTIGYSYSVPAETDSYKSTENKNKLSENEVFFDITMTEDLPKISLSDIDTQNVTKNTLIVTDAATDSTLNLDHSTSQNRDRTEVLSFISDNVDDTVIENNLEISTLLTLHQTVLDDLPSIIDVSFEASTETLSLSNATTSSKSTLVASSLIEEGPTSSQISTTTTSAPMDSITNENSSPSVEITFITNTAENNDTEEGNVDVEVQTSVIELDCPTRVPQVCPACQAQSYPTSCTTFTDATVTTPKQEDPVTCESTQCYAVAGRLLSLVDMSVDPCEDFHSFSCGGMLNSHLVPEEDPSANVWTRIEKAVESISLLSPVPYQQLKSYYESCVNYDKHGSFEEKKTHGRKVLDDIGEFTEASTTPEADLTDLLIMLFQHGSAPLFDLQLDVDVADSSKFQIVVSPPSHSSCAEGRGSCCRPKARDDIPLNLREAYGIYENCLHNFSQFIEETKEAFEFFGVLDRVDADNTSQLVQEILLSLDPDFFNMLKVLPSPGLVQRAVTLKTYKLIPRSQIDLEIPQIAWSQLFSSLLAADIEDTATIQVYFIDHIKALFTQLQGKDVRSVHNWLLAVFAHNLYKDIARPHNSCYKEQHCLRVLGNLLPDVTSNLYLETFPTDLEAAIRKQVKSIHEELELAMEDKISQAQWLDDASRMEITAKLKSMSVLLPQKFNESQLTDSLGECDLEGKQFLEASVCLLRQRQVRLYSRYGLDPHSTEALWSHFMRSYSTKPAFIYGLNTYLIPFAAVAAAYERDVPKHIIMAKMGNILARGFGHNFDYTGVSVAASGNAGTVLSEAAAQTYQKLVETSNLQFSWTKSHKEGNLVYSYLLDPELTLNQRLADITAANLSLSTVSNEDDSRLPWVPFTQEQVYFISLAQTFCSKKKVGEDFINLYEGTSLLPFDRVFNLAANSEKFAEVFKCPLGTNMNMHSELKTMPFPVFQKEMFHQEGVP